MDIQRVIFFSQFGLFFIISHKKIVKTQKNFLFFCPQRLVDYFEFMVKRDIRKCENEMDNFLCGGKSF